MIEDNHNQRKMKNFKNKMNNWKLNWRINKIFKDSIYKKYHNKVRQSQNMINKFNNLLRNSLMEVKNKVN